MLRLINKGYQFVADMAALSIAFWLAYLFRYEFSLPEQAMKQAFFAWPYLLLLQYAALASFGVPRFAWRFVGLRDAQSIVVAMAVATALLVGLRLGIGSSGGYLQFAALPLGVLGMNFILGSCAVIGARVARRMTAEHSAHRRRRRGQRERVLTLLIGAGEAGVLVARELRSRPDLGVHPVGFLDDNKLKVGTRVQGLRVLGTVDALDEIARHRRVRQAIITIAGASGAPLRRIVEACKAANVKVKIIPTVQEIVASGMNLNGIREVDIDDLLGREPVELESSSIESVVRDRTVLVTGGGGSIGSELCRQLALFRPKQLVLAELCENSLFHIHRELIARFPELDIIPAIADVRDSQRVDALFRTHRPDAVFHAAAHKHVPMMEWNPGEAIKNNVLGTQLVANAADRYEAKQFILISTDKAVNPTSVMGATKRVAELYVQAMSQRSRTRFSAVRFGNVLGSAGSVVPIFREQISRGGPVTVTDPEMRRYFMTISEACQLVLQAAALGDGGEIFVLDMGQPVKILDLARDLITLSGFEPDRDIAIQFTGVRPGEKLFEELSVAAECADKTRHPKIFIGRIAPHDWGHVRLGLRRLVERADGGDPADIRRALGDLVPEYSGAGPALAVPARAG